MKGNPFFGQARGKVGDLVFYRADGEQIARSLNRHPRNPNTDAQIIQRATMAVVQRLYSLGYPIFNHAFQGYRPGAENQRRFIKVNAKKIRDAVLASLNGSSTPVYLGAPGILSPSANAYIVSEGNYDQALFAYDATTPANPVWKLPEVGDATTVAEYAAAHGMVPGDIYTFLGVFTKSDVMDYEYFDTDGQLVEEASVRKASFSYLQLKVKDDILTNTDAISSSTNWSELFDEVRGTAGATSLNSGLSMVEVAGFDGSGAWGCIRSRENEDLRSTTTLQLFGAQSGVTPEWLFKVWSKEAANLASDLILEGADFNGAGGSATPTLPIEGGFYAVLGTFTSGNISTTNPIVDYDNLGDGPGVILTFAGAADSVAGESDVWEDIQGEVQASETAVGLTTSELNALSGVIAAALTEKYGVEVSSGAISDGDNYAEISEVRGNL